MNSADVDGGKRLVWQVSENLLREDMRPEELGMAFSRLVKPRNAEPGKAWRYNSVHQLAKAFGLSETRVQRMIDRANYPEQVDLLISIGVRHEDIIGQLCTQVRNGKMDLFDAFVATWNARKRDTGKNPPAEAVWKAVSTHPKTEPGVVKSADVVQSDVGVGVESGDAESGDESALQTVTPEDTKLDGFTEDEINKTDSQIPTLSVSGEVPAADSQPTTPPASDKGRAAVDENTKLDMNQFKIRAGYAVKLLRKLGYKDATLANAETLLLEVLEERR